MATLLKVFEENPTFVRKCSLSAPFNSVWIAAHSPQAKGRVERQFGTAQDRLVKGMRVAGVNTVDEANAWLEAEFLPWWNQMLAVTPASANDAHRPLDKEHDLASILSHVEPRKVANDYTVRYQSRVYQIDRADIRPGLRGENVRIEQRLDGTTGARFRDARLRLEECHPAKRVAPAQPAPRKSAKPSGEASRAAWKKFDLSKGPKLWQAAQGSGTRTGGALP